MKRTKRKKKTRRKRSSRKSSFCDSLPVWFRRSLFAKSFGLIDKRWNLIMPMDILFYLVFAVSSYIFMLMLLWQFQAVSSTLPFVLKMKAYTQIGMPADTSLLWSEMTAIEGFLNFFYARLITLIFAFVLWVGFVASFFKGIIWSRLLKKKFSVHFYNRFLKLNLVWLLSSSIVFMLLYLIVKPFTAMILFYVILVFCLYFLVISYPLFDDKTKTLLIVRQALWIGVLRFYKLLLPALYLLIFMALLLLVLSVAGIVLPAVITAVLLAAFAFFYTTWARGFWYLVIKKINKED